MSSYLFALVWRGEKGSKVTIAKYTHYFKNDDAFKRCPEETEGYQPEEKKRGL
jgi:hypothetical protein